MCRVTDIFAQDWISGSSGNDKGKGRADPNSTSNATMPSLSELRAQFVVVPPGDEAKSISCPICKENMKSEFMEDDEEWVWRNAVMKDDNAPSTPHLISLNCRRCTDHLLCPKLRPMV